LVAEAVFVPNRWMSFQFDLNFVVNSHMVVLREGTMKRHIVLHMVEIQYLKGRLAFEDTLDQFVEFQHEKY